MDGRPRGGRAASHPVGGRATAPRERGRRSRRRSRRPRAPCRRGCGGGRGWPSPPSMRSKAAAAATMLSGVPPPRYPHSTDREGRHAHVAAAHANGQAKELRWAVAHAGGYDKHLCAEEVRAWTPPPPQRRAARLAGGRGGGGVRAAGRRRLRWRVTDAVAVPHFTSSPSRGALWRQTPPTSEKSV